MAQTQHARKAPSPSPPRALTCALFAVLAFAAVAAPASAQSLSTGSPDLVISQVYTRGGEPGATFRNDFVEIFNRGNTTVNLADYSLQVLVNITTPGGAVLMPVSVRFVSSGGGRPVAPGQNVLYEFGSSGNNGAPLPVTPDAPAGGNNFNLPSATGRVAIIKGFGRAPEVSFAQLGCPVGADAALADFFSYGAATCVEGSANFPAPSATTAAVRNSDGCADTDNNAADFTTAAPVPRSSQVAARPCNLTAPANTIQFESDSVLYGEGAGSAEIFVTRTGDTSGSAQVQYATVDDTASERSDYTTGFGAVTFAPGETRKSFRVLITDDTRIDGPESFTVALNYPTNGFALGARHIARVRIIDEHDVNGPNPIDTTSFFVRQHYADFLSRDPDPSGFQFWQDNIESCGADAQCREVKRINVSAAFFLSIEFRDTGYYAYRAHKASYPDSASRPRGFPLYRELFRDAQRIGRGVIVGQDMWEQQLAANKQAYTVEFVTRPEFLLRYPTSQTPAQFVDLLNSTAGNPLSQAERDQQVAELTAAGNSTAGRASVLARVIGDADFERAEFNRAFVLMQYFGYLRRFPTDPPDNGSFAGYDFWLNKLNQFNGDYIQAEMVKAFISSIEYRQRFGP